MAGETSKMLSLGGSVQHAAHGQNPKLQVYHFPSSGWIAEYAPHLSVSHDGPGLRAGRRISIPGKGKKSRLNLVPLSVLHKGYRRLFPLV
jgi:hypothetical protein